MPRLLIILSVLAATLGWSAGEVRAADPKPPPGQDPGGHAVALIAGGIDYRDPALAARLARDGEGELIGWDVVDDDRTPFSAATGEGADAAGTDNSTSIAQTLLSGYARGRLVPVRAPRGNPQALAKAIAFAVNTPARIIAVALPLETDAMRQVIRQASERFKEHVFIVAGALPAASKAGAQSGMQGMPPATAAPPAPPAPPSSPQAPAASPAASLMNLGNVLVVMAASDVEGKSASDVIAATEVVVMPRGSAMFGLAGGAPRNAAEAVALAAANAACQSHGGEPAMGSAAKALALDASKPLEDNRAIRVLDPMCWYGGKRM